MRRASALKVPALPASVMLLLWVWGILSIRQL